MNKANYSDIKYDPELPFALVYSDEDETTVTSRFIEKEDAESWLKYNNYVNTRVVDTTPKPKIPEGAEFVTWQINGANEVAIYVNFNTNKAWEWYGMYYSEEDLLKEIGEAEVTVLVRKDET